MNKWTEHPVDDLDILRGAFYALFPSLLVWALIVAVIVVVSGWWT